MGSYWENCTGCSGSRTTTQQERVACTRCGGSGQVFEQFQTPGPYDQPTWTGMVNCHTCGGAGGHYQWVERFCTQCNGSGGQYFYYDDDAEQAPSASPVGSYAEPRESVRSAPLPSGGTGSYHDAQYRRNDAVVRLATFGFLCWMLMSHFEWRWYYALIPAAIIPAAMPAYDRIWRAVATLVVRTMLSLGVFYLCWQYLEWKWYWAVIPAILVSGAARKITAILVLAAVAWVLNAYYRWY